MARGQPSHFRAAMRLVAAGLHRRGAEPAPAQASPGRKLAVEHRGIVAHPARVNRYLEVTRGVGLYPAQSARAVLPPTYSAVWETALTLELLALEGLPFPSGGLIHLRSELVVLRAMHLGDRFRCRVELDRIEAHPRGTTLSLRCRSWNGAGQLCQENIDEILVMSRERQRAVDASGRRRGQGEDPVTGQNTERERRAKAEWDIPAEAGVRYARVSGDFNPVHLWPLTSRLFGYPRPILHGHCSMAMVAHELARISGGGIPPRVRTMEAAFRSPLALPARVRLMVEQGTGDNVLRFRLGDAAEAEGEGRRPYLEGKFVG